MLPDKYPGNASAISSKRLPHKSLPSVTILCTLLGQYKAWTADCGLRTADCGLRTADCGLQTADCGLRTADCALRTADCGLRTTDWV